MNPHIRFFNSFVISPIVFTIVHFKKAGLKFHKAPSVPKKYTSLKSKIFVCFVQSVRLVSFVGQVLNLDFDT